MHSRRDDDDHDKEHSRRHDDQFRRLYSGKDSYVMSRVFPSPPRPHSQRILSPNRTDVPTRALYEDTGRSNYQSPPARSRRSLSPNRADVPMRDLYKDTGRRNYQSPPGRSRRSLSPYRTDVPRRVLHEDTERRDYDWHSVRSRNDEYHPEPVTHFQASPTIAHFDDGIVHGMPKYAQDIGHKQSRLKHAYEYDNDACRTRRESNYADTEGRRDMGYKSRPVEDSLDGGSYKMPGYGENGERLQFSSRDTAISRFENKKVRHEESLPTDKIAAEEPYGRRKPSFPMRDLPYGMIPESHSKDFVDISGSNKVYCGNSSGTSRSYRDGSHLPSSDEYRRVDRTLTKPIRFESDERPLVHSEMDPEAFRRNPNSNFSGAYSSNRVEQHYFYPKSQEHAEEDREYEYDQAYNGIPCSRLSRDCSHRGYDQIGHAGKNAMHSVGDRVHRAGDPFENIPNSIARGHPDLPPSKHTIPENLNSRRPPYANDQGREFVDSGHSHVDFDRRVTRNYESQHLSISKGRQTEHASPDYGFERDFSPNCQNGELYKHPEYDLDMHRTSDRRQGAEEQKHVMLEPSHSMHRSRHILDEDSGKHDYRTNMSRKWNIPEEFEDLYDSNDEWIDEGMQVVDSPWNGRVGNSNHQETGSVYSRLGYPRDFNSNGRLSSQDSWPHVDRHTGRHYRSSGKHVRGHSRSNFLRDINPYHAERSGIRVPKVLKRRRDNDEDDHADDGGKSEYYGTHSGSSEDMEIFKKQVHEAFLKYSMKLNLNLAVQRRYKEQGKAGTLYCVSCGRSSSKEFTDTKGLAKHCLMSNRDGLRAQHLGLHRAICVLMGWNADTDDTDDTVKWIPEVLPTTEAWAKKEDLILWPPVVIIHNISLINNNPAHQMVLSIERVEDFLRGQGFVGVKMKVRLGNSGNESIIIVSFLSTFSGLGIAERIHKYFADKNQGRLGFELATSKSKNSSSSSQSSEAGKLGNNLEEQLLYGYMGVANDLHRLDLNTKKRVTIKSKTDVVELANAPV